MNIRTLFLPICIAALTGCSSIPLSFIQDRQVSERTALNRYPLEVLAIDGVYVPSDRGPNSHSQPISPGMHTVLFAAPPVAHDHFPVEKAYPMEIAPCTRYYVAADRENRLKRDWSLVVEYTSPEGNCDPAEELRKAAAAGGQPARAPAAAQASS